MIEGIKNALTGKQSRKYGVFIVLVAIAYLLRDFLPMLVITLIFSYFAVKSASFFARKMKMPWVVATVLFYLLLVGIVGGIISYAIPIFVSEGQKLYDVILTGLKDYPKLSAQVVDIVDKYSILDNLKNNWQQIIANSLDIASVVTSGLTKLLLALFLSLIFTLTYPKLLNFGHRFERSDFPYFFKASYRLIRKFAVITGKILEVQLVIDLVNTSLMVLIMLALKLPSPFVLGLFVMIFGLVPIAGVLISSIPLVIIAFTSGGLKTVLILLVLIVIIHMVEAYVLHPKLMSERSELPIFVTFVTLFLMEHLLGAWGLLMGVPIVAFLMDMMGVIDFEKHQKKSL